MSGLDRFLFALNGAAAVGNFVIGSPLIGTLCLGAALFLLSGCIPVSR